MHKPTLAFIMLMTGTSATISAECIVKPHSTIRVGASSQGIVSEVYVDRSDRVIADQIIAKLNSAEEQSREALAQLRAQSSTAIETAQNAAETAELRLKRTRALHERKITSSADLEEAKLQAKTAQLQVEQANHEQAIAQLEVKSAAVATERKNIRSPVNGVILSRLISKGELYNEQGPIFIVARTNPLHIETFLPLKQWENIKLGQTVSMVLETDEKVKGKIIVIDAVLDAATGTFGIQIEVQNPNGDILAGQRCEVNFDQK